MIDTKELRRNVTEWGFTTIDVPTATMIDLLDQMERAEKKSLQHRGRFEDFCEKLLNANTEIGMLKEEREKLVDVLKEGRHLVTPSFMLHMRSDRQIRFDAAVEACADIQIEGVE